MLVKRPHPQRTAVIVQSPRTPIERVRKFQSYRRILVTATKGSGGGGLGARGCRIDSDFDPIGEPDTLNELGQLVVAIEPAPAFLRRINELEHHGERRLIR